MEREVEVGANIRRLREQAGLTQTQLAERLGVGQRAVSAWEVGVIRLTGLQTAKRIADALGASVDELVRPADEPAAVEAEVQA